MRLPLIERLPMVLPMSLPILLPMLLLLLLACRACAVQAAPPLVVPDGQPGQAGCRAGHQAGFKLAAPGAGLLVAAGFERLGWSGRLEARALAIAAGGAIEIGAAPLWEAGALLNDRAPHERKIYTLARDTDGLTTTVAFAWASLPAVERARLDADGQGEVFGERLVGFLRGERARRRHSQRALAGGRAIGGRAGAGLRQLPRALQGARRRDLPRRQRRHAACI
ncbi:hypothetical protein [Massilia psychrophila]|uniref:hypothetical protein n=1 Tax=Massilia psychrophila TaxID=1603353 RepID=UPI001E5682E4|nr:hypothetical protein [Massilia psychrophila]